MTRARELARLGNENVFTAEDYNSPVEVGINSTNPSSTLDVRGDLKVGTEVQLGTAGIVTAVQFSGNITGVAATFSGDVSIGGTLTYEDVTNIDSVGIVTARAGVNVSGGQLLVGSGVTIGNAGVATFSGTSDIHLLDSVEFKAGDGSDFKIVHNSSLSPDTTQVITASSQRLQIQTDSLRIVDSGSARDLIQADDGGAAALFFNGSNKFITTKDGTVTTGISTVTGDVSIADKIIHTGDTNTAIRFPAGDEIQFETGGSTRLHIGSGNITQTIDTDGEGLIITTGSADMKPMVTGNSNRGAANNTIFGISGKWNNTEVGRIAFEAGADTTNKDDGKIRFYTRPSGGSLTSRLTVTSEGSVGVNEANPEELFHISDTTAPAIQLEATSGGPYKTLIKMGGNDMEIRGSSGNIEFFNGNADGDSSTERMRLDGDGRLLLGAGSVTLPKGSSTGSMDLDNGNITMCVGGNVNSTGRTNSTNKICRITTPHYTNTEEPVMLMMGYMISGDNKVVYGGGTSQGNSATLHEFYTAADTTTTTGTLRLQLNSAGNATLSATAPYSHSSDRHFEIGEVAANKMVLQSGSNVGCIFAQNAVYDGSAYKYIGSDEAGRMQLLSDGALQVATAAAGTAGNSISWNKGDILTENKGATGHITNFRDITSGNAGIGVTVRLAPSNNWNTRFCEIYAENTGNNLQDLHFKTCAADTPENALTLHRKDTSLGSTYATIGNQNGDAMCRILPISTNVAASSTKTVTITGLTGGTFQIAMGGYSNAGQSAWHYHATVGGYMTGTNMFNVTELASWISGGSISVTKNASNLQIAVTNNSSDYTLQMKGYAISGAGAAITIAYS